MSTIGSITSSSLNVSRRLCMTSVGSCISSIPNRLLTNAPSTQNTFSHISNSNNNNKSICRATVVVRLYQTSATRNSTFYTTTKYSPSFSKTSKTNQKYFSSSEQKRDVYEVLGVPRSADKGTIKKAYFKLAKEHHPDRNKDDSKAADKFKEVTAAYEVLSDDKQRELYDNYGHAGIDPNSGFGDGGGGGNPFDGGFGGFNFNDGSFHVHSSGGPDGGIDAEELFEAFFGGGGSRRRKPRGPKPGADLQMHVKLTFKEAVFGASKDLHLRYQARDPKNNNRVLSKERDVTVDVPAGIDTGMNLRMPGKGAEGEPGAENGNLFVQVIIEDDPYFKRDGQDVHTDIPISFVQAVLGGTVDVKTLTGTVEMKVPKGCQMNTKLLLRNKGIPMVNSHNRKGNHIVHLQIEIPKKFNKKQEELLRQFDEESQICGLGLSGKLAKAAGSVFETIFCSSKKKDLKKKKDTSAVNDKGKGDDVKEKEQPQ